MDNLLSRGVWAVLLWLGAATAVVVLISSLLLTVFGLTFADSESTSWVEDLWQSLLRTLDTGTMAADTGWGPRALALIVTLAGILLAGTLIGLIASGVEQRVQQMQRGKSTVVESGHIVILGTSSRLPKLIEQLAIAGRDRARNVIVVLADCEPRELREAVGTNRARLHGSHLVIRSGLTDRVSDLSMVRVREARAVIVVAEDDAENDTDVVKAVLAVGSAAGGFGRKPIIAELREVAMAERLARACGDSVHPIVTTVAIARLTSFMLRDPGMADVVDELMDASGGGIDLIDASDVVGLPFGEIVRRFHGMRPIGLIGDDGTVRLNPDGASVPVRGDRLVTIRDHEAPPTAATEPFAAEVQPQRSGQVGPADQRPEEHLVVVGWNALGATLVASVAEVSSPGSSAEIVYDPDLFDADEIEVPTSTELSIALTPSPRLSWELSDVEAAKATSFVLLGYVRGLSAGEADSRTLLALMLLRKRLADLRGPTPRVIVELRDADNVDLARQAGADEYIVSDAIAGRFMAQLAEQPERRLVFLALYASAGPSLRLVTAEDLALVGTVSFGDVVTAAQAAGMLAIGWRRASTENATATLSPTVSTMVDLAPADQIIVVA
jgi:Trk K+ transport system NAD-binding subunit